MTRVLFFLRLENLGIMGSNLGFFLEFGFFFFRVKV